MALLPTHEPSYDQLVKLAEEDVDYTMRFMETIGEIYTALPAKSSRLAEIPRERGEQLVSMEMMTHRENPTYAAKRIRFCTLRCLAELRSKAGSWTEEEINDSSDFSRLPTKKGIVILSKSYYFSVLDTVDRSGKLPKLSYPTNCNDLSSSQWKKLADDAKPSQSRTWSEALYQLSHATTNNVTSCLESVTRSWFTGTANESARRIEEHDENAHAYVAEG